MVVPKAAIYQTQTFFAKGKMKEIKQLVANIRGESLSSGKTETWSGKMLKIPPVSPSILDCSIIRVEYSLMVSVYLFIFFRLPIISTCAGIFYSLKIEIMQEFSELYVNFKQLKDQFLEHPLCFPHMQLH